jgi:hypothetical protein
VILRITAVIASAITGSAAAKPSATTTALTITPRLTSVDPGVISVGNEGRAVEPPARARPDHRCDEVATEPDHARESEGEQLIGRIGVEQAVDRFERGDAGADEDREHHGEPYCSTRSERRANAIPSEARWRRRRSCE